jgi:hypothetical protein
MFPTRRAFSAASRQLASRTFRPIQSSARLYATETATSTTEQPATTSTPAKASTSTTANSSATRYAKPAAKAAKPAMAASITYEDIAYQPKDIAFEDAKEEDGEVLDPATVDWTKSFYGISAKPVTEKQFKFLVQPVEEKDIEVKPDGVIYLPEIKYRRRLNEAFGPMGWGLIPKGEAIVSDTIVTREYALIVGGR